MVPYLFDCIWSWIHVKYEFFFLGAFYAGAPVYPTDFSIEVHHGGAFTLKPRKVYSGGKIDTVNGLNSDYLSMLELDGLVQQLGYAPNVLFYCKKPNCSLDKGLVPIRCDKDAYGMLDSLHKDRTIVLYLEHVGGLDPIESQVGSSKNSVTQAQVIESQVGSSKNGVAQAQVIDLDAEPQVDLWPATLESHVKVSDLDVEPYIDLGPINLESGFVFEEGNMEQGNGLDDVNIEDVNQVHMGDANSDSSSDNMSYSDHSYQESDDDRLYDTFVDENEEFVGFPDIDERNPHVEPVNDQGQLSDGEPKYDSDYSFHSSSDEETDRRLKPPFKTFKPETDMEDPRFMKGQYFNSAKEFKEAVKQHAIKHQRNVKLVKNDKRRVRAKCESPCEWLVYAAKVLADSKYQVRTYKSKHTCTITYSNRNVTSYMIAKRFMEDLRTNPRIPLQSFKDRVRKEMKVDISRNQVYRAKIKAAQLIYGSDLEQYGRLWDYCAELRRSNPGSTVVMDAPIDSESGQPRFNRLYIFLAAPKTGFLSGCRKIIGVDGCHLKGQYSGQLLTAIGVDPNNASYPLAYCVVETESKDTWKWFFTLLKMDCNITAANEHEWTFINDRQKVMFC